MKNSCLIFLVALLSGCHIRQASKQGEYRVVNEAEVNTSFVSHGIPAYTFARINYKRDQHSAYRITLNEPVVISVASKPEKWGYFQFPHIGRETDGTLVAQWHMAADAVESYGAPQSGSAVSTDDGKSWQPRQDPVNAGGILLANGDQIAIFTPKPLKAADLSLPATVGAGFDNYAKVPYIFYRLQDLPESVKGVRLNRLKKGETAWKEETALLNDPKGIRYTFKGLFPVVWWGDIRIAADKSLIAGIYPGFYLGENGVGDPKSGIFFYRSTDNGHSWNVHSRLPYRPDLELDSLGEGRMGFMEPAFEILSDGRYLCVSRTTDGLGLGPMYGSYSTDKGLSWSKPEIISPAGVLPRLLQLENGVTVLASGRPGVQIRFSDSGKQWSNPFEMLPFQPGDDKDQISCGYTGLLATGPDRFAIIYSDFRFQTSSGDTRKAIKVREVVVSKK